MFKLFLLIFLTFPSVSGALTCLKDYAGTASCLENENTAGDCITLGYSTDNVEGCSNYLYCPFNTAYKKCVAGGEKLDCEKLGYTTDDKSAWCSNIITCPNNITLTACVGQCVYNDICVDKIDEATASMPSQFAQLQFEDCTACGETGQVVTGWKCNDGYIRVNDVYMVTGSLDYYSCEGGKRPISSSSAIDCCINCTAVAAVSGTLIYYDANGGHQVKKCQ